MGGRGLQRVVRDEAVKYTLDCLHFAASGNNASSNKPLSSLGGLSPSFCRSSSLSHIRRDTHTQTQTHTCFFKANCILFLWKVLIGFCQKNGNGMKGQERLKGHASPQFDFRLMGCRRFDLCVRPQMIDVRLRVAP